ncbi:MalY/PatB family protein [Corynebacterium confusum]|uniref:MalY/PatB family protein n=1 Tax=uncultured Corynebacterium sp. TaxID=159447 RepID=UPI0025D9EE38|nr:aminotransferase class I/II-fold pyridoxal phosphate-dependent enzyme [uncultured Corynebacterium sp.]
MEFPSLEQLAARGTRKWTVYDSDVTPLWIAESDFPTAPAVKDAIQGMVDRETFGYTPAPRVSDLPGALADFYAKRFGWRPDEKGIFWIGDVVRGMLLGVQYFTRPDSPVVVPVPSYPPLLEVPATAGREKVEVSAELDLAEIERAFSAGAGSILLANPYNPLGRVLDEGFLRGLVELARTYDARILADEIHAPLVFEGQHTPVASVGPDVTITATSTSKAFNVAGLKCAQMIFSNPADIATWKKLTGVAKDGTGTLGVIAAEAAYRDGGEHLDEELAYLKRTRDWLLEELPQRVPGIKTACPQATYLLWLDFSDTTIGSDPHPARWVLENARVALNEGSTFGTGGEHHARLNFATSREILQEALDRLGRAFEN